jgi:hypothetical protein
MRVSNRCTRRPRRAARKDPVIHKLLASLDTLRDGRVRERQLAEKELSARDRSADGHRNAAATQHRRTALGANLPVHVELLAIFERRRRRWREGE